MNFVGLHQTEKALVKHGFDSMGREERNDLVSFISRKKGLDFTEIDRDFLVEYHRNLKVRVLSDICNDKIVEGFTASNGHHYRTNRDDQLNMIGKQTQLNSNPEIDVVRFKTQDVGYIEHSRDEFTKVYNEGIDHKEFLLYRYDDLKAQVMNAETDEEIANVNWE